MECWSLHELDDRRQRELEVAMDPLLFSARSIRKMIDGIVLGGGALLGLAAALFSLATMRVMKPGDLVDATARSQARYLGWLLGFSES